MKKLPLTNTETKSIPIGSNIKATIRKHDPKDAPQKAGGKTPQFDVPSHHTSRKILDRMRRLREDHPDLIQMVDEKLGSPNTAKYIRKKKAAKVNIPESEKVFKDLVSTEVSQESLIRVLEEDLRHRAAISQPAFKPADPTPSLNDYFTEDISVRVVGPSNIFPHQKTNPLVTSDPGDVKEYCDRILNNYSFMKSAIDNETSTVP